MSRQSFDAEAFWHDPSTESETTRVDSERNPVLNHEPAGLDSGDQMPSEPSLWGDRRGRQSLMASTERPHRRWLVALRQWLGRGAEGAR
jgi:hypothetical protein